MERMEQMYQDYKLYNSLFRKKTYMKAATHFCDAYFPVFEKYLDMAEETSVQNAASEYVNASAEALRSMKKSRRLPGKSKMMQINLYIATYVMPAIIATNRSYSEEFANSVAAEWNKTFKKSKISCADFNTIDGGFELKFMGLPVQWGERKS